MSINNYLPKDCLINVFKELPIEEYASTALPDIFSCTSVNKEWNNAASSDTLWAFFISKVFPSPSNIFLGDTKNSFQLSQKEIYKYSHNLRVGLVVVDGMLPTLRRFTFWQDGGMSLVIDESGNSYSWNSEKQKFGRIKTLWESPQFHEHPYNGLELSLQRQEIFKVSNDSFAVLCKKSGHEIKGTASSPEIKKAKGCLIKIFNDKYEKIKEIPLPKEVRDLQVAAPGQFVGITDPNVLMNICDKFIQTHVFTHADRIGILYLNQGKCWVVASYDNSKFTTSLLDVEQGIKLLGEIDSHFVPKFPLNAEFYPNRIMLLYKEENCQIFDLSQGSNVPVAEIPFGKNLISLAFFNSQGKLFILSSVLEVVVLDPENQWQRIENETKASARNEDSGVLIYCSDQAIFYNYTDGTCEIIPKHAWMRQKVIAKGLIIKQGQLTNCDPSTQKMMLQLVHNLEERGTLDKFELLSKRTRNAVYGHLYNILNEQGKLSSIPHYWGMGEDALKGRGDMAGIASRSDKIAAMKRAVGAV